MSGEFSFEEAERRLGPAAVAEARRSAAEAPELRPEQLEHLRQLFASAMGPVKPQPAANAA
ncbi:hypothetical protein [Streptomyces viridochromogenes]|uniref:hypothetical protein n=1 Tax=Streptomyces viridochromogenes TaxID=1938 RepID=UPI00069F9541|nr:hypothetical protein [Streptomyces viridochromogenes]KOG21757.1 hypothetical protein ADK36_12285 [Streptomyces viridochromogenes]